MGDRWFMVALAVGAFLLVVFVRWLPITDDASATDYHEYYRPVVESWQRGEGLTMDGDAAVRYPPGYPALLLAFSIVPWGPTMEVTILNGVSLAVCGLLCFSVVRELGSRREARWAGVGVATYPLLVYSASAPGTELPFIALVLAGTYAMLRSIERGALLAVVSGGLIGAASLVRPAGALLGLVLAGLAVAWKRDRRTVGLAAVLLAANLAVIAPWQVWANSRSDQAVILGTMGMSTAVSGLTINGRDEAEGREVPVPQAVDDLGRRALARQDDLIDPGGLLAFLRDEFDRAPFSVVGLLVVKAARSWYGTDSVRHEGAILLVQMPYVAMGVWGGWLLRRRRLGSLCSVFIAYFWLTTVASVSIVRYLLPGLVFLVCLAMVGAAHLFEARHRREPTGPAAGVRSPFEGARSMPRTAASCPEEDLL